MTMTMMLRVLLLVALAAAVVVAGGGGGGGGGAGVVGRTRARRASAGNEAAALARAIHHAHQQAAALAAAAGASGASGAGVTAGVAGSLPPLTALAWQAKLQHLVTSSSSAVEHHLDYASDTWAAMPYPLPPDIEQHWRQVTVACQGLIYAVGGASGLATNLTHVYFPSNRTWLEIAPLNIPRFYHAGYCYNERIFVFGGASEHHYVMDSGEWYDVHARVWRLTAPMLAARAKAMVVRDGDALWLVGGERMDGPTASVDIYYPERDEWKVASW